MEKKTSIRLAICGTTAALVVAAAAITTYLQPKDDLPPMPFGEQRGPSLTGDLTKIGKSDIAEVYKVTFPEGVDHEDLSVDHFYLVYTPEDSLQGVPLDSVLALEDGSHDVSYFGYQYSSPRAELEREHKNDELLRDRFPTPPGKFFASHKARFGDDPNSDAFADFESGNGITMLPTDTVEGATLEPNQLYLIIVNEPSARIMVRSSGGGDGGGGGGDPALWGNGNVDPGEECDDGNDIDNDDCTNTSELYVVNPFAVRGGGGQGGGDGGGGDDGPSAFCGDNKIDPGEDCDNGERNGSLGGSCSQDCRTQETGPACGDGKIEGAEACDDDDTDSGDGCSDACAIEEKTNCQGSPSVCISYNAFVKKLANIKDSDSEGTRGRKALTVELDLLEVTEKDYALVKKYDINNDGKVDSTDVDAISEELTILAP